jgi:hypothetical protein
MLNFLSKEATVHEPLSSEGDQLRRAAATDVRASYVRFPTPNKYNSTMQDLQSSSAYSVPVPSMDLVSKLSPPYNDTWDGNSGNQFQPDPLDESLLYWAATLQRAPDYKNSRNEQIRPFKTPVWQVEELASLPTRLVPGAARLKYGSLELVTKQIEGDLQALTDELRESIEALKRELDSSQPAQRFAVSLTHLEYLVWRNTPISVRAFRSSHKSSRKTSDILPRPKPDRLRVYFVRIPLSLKTLLLAGHAMSPAEKLRISLPREVPQPDAIENTAVEKGQPSFARELEEIGDLFSMEPELEALALVDTGTYMSQATREVAENEPPIEEPEKTPQMRMTPDLKLDKTINSLVDSSQPKSILLPKADMDDDAIALDELESSLLGESEPYIDLFSTFFRLVRKHTTDFTPGICPMDSTELLDDILDQFLWRLYEESDTASERELSCIMNKKRHFVAHIWHSLFFENERHANVESPQRKPPLDSTSMMKDWDAIFSESLPESKFGEKVPPESAADNSYQRWVELFLQDSNTFMWLISRIQQLNGFACKGLDAKMTIGSTIRGHIRQDSQLCEMYPAQGPPSISLIFNLQWDPAEVLRDHGIPTSQRKILERLLCFTGTLLNAQAVTIIEYMKQTWPGRWQHLAIAISKFMYLPKGAECLYEFPDPKEGYESKRKGKYKMTTEDFEYGPKGDSKKSHGLRGRIRARMTGNSSCYITISGGPETVCEMAEQLAWLAATLRSRPDSLSDQGIVSCTPFISNIRRPSEELFWVCDVAFDIRHVPMIDDCDGSCWANLFWNPILVEGYPIRARNKEDTGLEIELSAMGVLMRSLQLVLWNRKLLMKGFDALVVATQMTAGTVFWHLLTSKERETRISYIEPEVDRVALKLPEGYSLHSLEKSRHVIGWCSKATDFCGKSAFLNLLVACSTDKVLLRTSKHEHEYWNIGTAEAASFHCH